MTSSLLDPAFVRELEALRRVFMPRIADGRTGDVSSRRRGGGSEFRDHRAYSPGDDPRRIDWLAVARSDELVVKQFHAEEDVRVRILLDASASLEGPAFTLARRVAAGLGYIALAEGHRVQLLPFSSRVTASHAIPRGRSGVPVLLRALDALRPTGRTDLAAVADRAAADTGRGVTFVVSDFLDPDGVDRPLRRIGSARQTLSLVQVLDADAMAPPWGGDVVFEDAETGSTVELTLDEAAVTDYLARLDGLFAALASVARAHGGGCVRVTPAAALDRALRALLERRADAGGASA